jgi:mRNA interferase MazF
MRPILLLSRDDAYIRRRQFQMAPVTTQVRGLRTEVPIGTEEGLPRPSVVNLDVLNMVERRYLRNRIGELSLEKMLAVERAIHFALDLSY